MIVLLKNFQEMFQSTEFFFYMNDIIIVLWQYSLFLNQPLLAARIRLVENSDNTQEMFKTKEFNFCNFQIF